MFFAFTCMCSFSLSFSPWVIEISLLLYLQLVPEHVVMTKEEVTELLAR